MIFNYLNYPGYFDRATIALGAEDAVAVVEVEIKMIGRQAGAETF
jgi:hypothetical protein